MALKDTISFCFGCHWIHFNYKFSFLISFSVSIYAKVILIILTFDQPLASGYIIHSFLHSFILNYLLLEDRTVYTVHQAYVMTLNDEILNGAINHQPSAIIVGSSGAIRFKLPQNVCLITLKISKYICVPFQRPLLTAPHPYIHIYTHIVNFVHHYFLYKI